MRIGTQQDMTLPVDLYFWNIKNRLGQVDQDDVWAGEACVNGARIAQVNFNDKCTSKEDAKAVLLRRLYPHAERGRYKEVPV